jgi:hypothetical protein
VSYVQKELLNRRQTCWALSSCGRESTHKFGHYKLTWLSIGQNVDCQSLTLNNLRTDHSDHTRSKSGVVRGENKKSAKWKEDGESDGGKEDYEDEIQEMEFGEKGEIDERIWIRLMEVGMLNGAI